MSVVIFLLSNGCAIAQPLSARSARPLAQVLPTETVIPATDLNASAAAILFELNCAGCHLNGGNVIRRGKNLKQKAMMRNGYGDIDAIAAIITNGKGIMSAYGDRLSGDEISAIAKYVHEQSKSGWQH